MKKVKLLTLFLVSVLALGLVACGDSKEKLGTPNIIDVDGKILFWTEVEHADKYIIDVNGTLFESTTASFDFSVVDASVYEIKVKAIDTTKTFKDGDFSSLYVHEIINEPEKLTSPVIKLENTSISWAAVSNAVKYQVVVNGETYESQTTSFNLKDIVLDAYEIVVIAVADGINYSNSDNSNLITITPINNVKLDLEDLKGDILTAHVLASSGDSIYGFVLDISYDNVNLEIQEEDIIIKPIIDETWLYDIYINEGHILISITGLDPIEVRLLQPIFTLDFKLVGNSFSVKLENSFIDNN